MQTRAVRRETGYLRISTIGNALVGCVGITAAAISGSQAILLDGVFNITYFLVGIFGIKVSALVAGGDDEEFPYGYSYLEPLVNGIKGSLVLGVSIMAAIGAIHALCVGGRPINAGLAIAYGVFASSVCGFVAWLMHRGARKVDSPMIKADAENWLVNAAVSSCVLIAFIGIFLLRAVGLDQIVPYVDPVVVLAVVSISLGVPLKIIFNSLMALLNRAPAKGIRDQVVSAVDDALTGSRIKERFVRVLQPGRQRMVFVHVVLPEDQTLRVADLDDLRTRTHEALCKDHLDTFVDMVFTADRRWGAPYAETVEKS